MRIHSLTKTLLAACVALLGISLVRPAVAGTITTFDVTGTFANPSSTYGLSGTITINTTLGTVTNSSLTVTGGTAPGNAFTGVPAESTPYFDGDYLLLWDNPTYELQLVFTTITPQPLCCSTLGTLVGFTGGTFDNSLGTGNAYETLGSGSEVAYTLDGNITPAAATTPLPTALPLFATGLGALGLLGWRRKRKNAAAMAAA